MLEDMKLCTTCGVIKSLDDFNKNKARPDGVGTKCRDCMKAYRKQYYSDNRELVIAKVRVRNDSVKAATFEKVFEYLSNHPCVDCGNSDPRVLDFDHRDRIDKVFTIGKKINESWTWDKLLSEIAKCDVRCKNCHAIRTQVQMNHTRRLWLPVTGT